MKARLTRTKEFPEKENSTTEKVDRGNENNYRGNKNKQSILQEEASKEVEKKELLEIEESLSDLPPLVTSYELCKYRENEKVEKFLLENEEVINRLSEEFFDSLGVDLCNFRKNPVEIIKDAIRREFFISMDIGDQLQNLVSRFYKNPEHSYGPLQIRPNTYLKSVLENRGIQSKKTWKENVTLAIENNIFDEDELKNGVLNKIHSILKNDPEKAIRGALLTLRRYIPEEDEKIPVVIEKEEEKTQVASMSLFENPFESNKKKKITLTMPRQDFYKSDYITNQNGTKEVADKDIKISHDELRLMVALARYQGSVGGIRLTSKDSEVFFEDGEIIPEKNPNLAFNNQVLSIVIGTED